MNPILPIEHFVPDAEARQWSDGRMYLYGSYDISGRTSYCSWEYHVFSSADLIHWVDHGESFRSAGPNTGVPWTGAPLFAPDCIYYRGRYYLFFCNADNSEGVAESVSPTGSFTNAAPVEGANGDAIDPAVLVDDDGQVYYYWGQFHLRGAKLRPDLRGVQPETLCTDLITEAGHGFHEGASIRKRNGLYYLVYTDISRGRPTCMSYATSRSPLGPFTKGGVIIDNTGCDRETWNNHGSIAIFAGRSGSVKPKVTDDLLRAGGQWYVFYHRSSQASQFNRRVCVEPIHFNTDGSIDEVEMTTQGLTGPLPAVQRIEAWRACLLHGQVHTAADGPTESDPVVRERLTLIHHNDWAAYKCIDFEAKPVDTFYVRAASLAYGGLIEIHLDQPDGELIGTCEVHRTGGWQKWATFSCPVREAKGVRAVYLVCKGREGRLSEQARRFDLERLFDLESFWFAGDGNSG
jgi:Glycosyl hydrolases family 43/Carbohydrate binding module (family 6)